MINGNFHNGLEVLYDQKNITLEEKRRVAATSLALDLISHAISKQGSDAKLKEEMDNLSTYVEHIYEVLSKS